MVKLVGMGARPKKASKETWEEYLEPGETLLWEGAPARGVRVTGSGVVMSIFGLLFLGFSVFWVSMATSMTMGMGGWAAFPFFGVPFVLIGLWLVFGHWAFDAYKRKRSRYAVTSRRALIARKLYGRKMHSYPITRQSQIRLIKGKLDTVNFAEITRNGKNGTYVVPIGFRYISDGKKVYDLLREIRSGLK